MYTFIYSINNSRLHNMNKHKDYIEANIEKYFQGDNVAMAKAIFNEDTNEITRLVKEEGYDVDTRDIIRRGFWTYQWTYLNYAVTKGKRKSVIALLDLGADINKLLMVAYADSNLNLAAGHCDHAMVELLLNHNVKMNHTIATSPFEYAMLNDCYSEELFDLLIEHGANIDHPHYISGNTPLMTAYDIDNLEAVDYFLNKGADPTKVNSNGHSFASFIQLDLDNNKKRETALKYKQHMINDYGIQYPINVSYRKGIKQSIKRYEMTTAKERELLGEEEIELINDMRESLITGIFSGVPID